jgi:sugar lactone lactonase YvrE
VQREDDLESRLIWPVEAQLGEGPVWIVDEAALWFVDIKSGNLHRLDPATGARRTCHVGGQPSFVVPRAGGGLLVGSGHALHRFDHGALGAPIATIDMPAHNRTNDATVDPSGRLWFGTMDDGETRASGAVHVVDAAGLRAVGGGCTITNGPAVSLDGHRLYHVDTLAGTIWRFDIRDGTALADGSVFATIAKGDGSPDGVTIDSEGCLWVALWGGWAVRRYAPDGSLLATVRLPCANVTKIAFGGADLRTAYVTTARAGLSAAELGTQPLAGGLFAFDAPAPGVALPGARFAS